MRDPDARPVQDRVLFDLFYRVRKQGRITQFVNLETHEHVNSEFILNQVYTVPNAQCHSVTVTLLLHCHGELCFEMYMRECCFDFRFLQNKFICLMTSFNYLQSDQYAKGLLSLGILKTGEDFSAMIGCFSMEALAVWVGCISIGVASMVRCVVCVVTTKFELNTLIPVMSHLPVLLMCSEQISDDPLNWLYDL